MTPEPVAVLDATAVRSEALTWPERARATAVTDAVTYTGACELLKGIKALRGKIAETFDPHILRALDAHRALLKEKADAESPLTEAEGILKRALVAYDDEQERLRRAEEARLREEARRQEEQRRLEEAAALEREAAATGQDELREEAELLINEPVAAPAVIVAKSTPKVAGVSFRENWSGRVTNLPKLIAFVAANPQFSNLLTVNSAALNQMARAQKQGFKVPGAEAVCQKVAAAGVR